MTPTLRGGWLALAGVLLFGGTLLVSAAAAPTVSVAGEGTEETLVGSQGTGPGWHQGGSVYLLEGTGVAWRLDGALGADSYFDVTMTDDGTVLAGFIEGGYERCGRYDSPCHRTGFRLLSPPPDPAVLEAYSFPVASIANSETHDVEVLPSGEFVLTDMDRERILTVRNDTVTWEWSAASLYDAPPDPTETDWLHINDVDYLGDDRFLVSVRNANQLVVVERDRGVVEVINRDDGGDDSSCRGSGQLEDYDGDGDVRCGDPDVLDHQHNPQWLGDGRVLVADSENDRVVELARTDDGWEPAWSLESAGRVALDWPRDADRLPNGNTLITDTLNKRVLEVTPNGTVVWSVSTPNIPYEADRLPDGETVGGPANAGNVTATPGRLPVLTPALVGLRAVVPGVPFWFNELQLGLALLSVVLVVAGAYDRRR